MKSISNGDKKIGDKDVWFDGVDKRLIEMHSAEHLIECNQQTLMTKTALDTLVLQPTKRKQPDNRHKKLKNGHHKTKSSQPIASSTTSGRVIKPNSGITDELAMDCEMVECYNHKSVLARVSIVNLFGHTVLDRYVAPPAKVTDYRTRFSGIRRRNLINAPEFEVVRNEVSNLIKNKIVVGHALHNDFGVLKITHPPDKIRDTSQYFKHLFQGKTPSLKKLSESMLGIKIQKGEHNSVQDAQAAMKLYVRERDKWNEKLLNKDHTHNPRGSKGNRKPKKKKIKTFYVLTA